MSTEQPATPTLPKVKRKRTVLKPVTARSPVTNFPTSGGESRRPELGYEGDAARIGTLKSQAELFSQMLVDNHKAIADIAYALDKAQPNSIGRLEVRWWKPRTGTAAEPMVITYSARKGYPEKVKHTGLVQRAKSRHGFARNYEDAKILLAYLEDLLATRVQLLKCYHDFNRVVTNVQRNSHLKLTEVIKSDLIGIVQRRIDQRAYEANSHV
jgi:hypothetical protein